MQSNQVHNHNQIYKDIEEKVMNRISHTRIVRARWHFALHATSILVAIFAFIPAINSFNTSASHSGFSNYISLFSTDWSYMINSWKSFGLLLIESMPIIETVAIVGLVLIIANSLQRSKTFIPLIHKYE